MPRATHVSVCLVLPLQVEDGSFRGGQFARTTRGRASKRRGIGNFGGAEWQTPLVTKLAAVLCRGLLGGMYALVLYVLYNGWHVMTHNKSFIWAKKGREQDKNKREEKQKTSICNNAEQETNQKPARKGLVCNQNTKPRRATVLIQPQH